MSRSSSKAALLVVAIGVGGALSMPSAAKADLITLGLQQSGVNGGAVTAQSPTGSGSLTIGSISYGSFSINSLIATDTIGSALPELLNSASVNVSTSIPGTINIWVTAQGLTQPTGLFPIVSSFTSNSLPTDWTVTESTFYDAGNGLFTTTTPLSSHMFSANGTDVLTSTPVLFTSPFSITEEYTITSNGTVATALSTVHTAAVPEPASLALFGTALLGLGWLGRRRRKNV